MGLLIKKNIAGLLEKSGLLKSRLCVAGCALGTLIGCGIALIQQHFGIVKIPGDTLLENYPVSLNIGEVATIVIIVIITMMMLKPPLQRRHHRLNLTSISFLM